jgi:hypothetical protein
MLNSPNRRPIGGRKFTVDPAHHLIDGLLELLVLLHVGSRRHRNLQQAHFATMLWMFLEQHFERLQPMHQTLGVVQPIDAQDDLHLCVQHFLCDFCQLHEPVKRNTNRQWTNTNRSATVFDQQVLAVHTTAQVTLATVDEIQAIVTYVEPNQIAGQHSLQNFVGPGKQAENVPRWERNVQEKGQLTLESFLLGHFTHIIGGQHEVVVVNPNDRWSRFGLVTTFQGLDRFQGKLFVHFDVGLPVISAEGRTTWHRMKQGPVGLITASVIVEVEQNGVNVDGHNLKFEMFRTRRLGTLTLTHLAGFETCGWSVVGRIRFGNRFGLIIQMDARPTDP